MGRISEGSETEGGSSHKFTILIILTHLFTTLVINTNNFIIIKVPRCQIVDIQEIRNRFPSHYPTMPMVFLELPSSIYQASPPFMSSLTFSDFTNCC